MRTLLQLEVSSHMVRFLLLVCSIASCGMAAGCGEMVQSTSTRPTRPDADSAPTDGAAPTGSIKSPSIDTDKNAQPAAESVDLVEANWADLLSLIAKQKGKIVVVDVWSTACEPCMKEFPHLLKLQKQYPDDVVAISFDIDFAGIKNKPTSFYRKRVLEFLESQGKSKVTHLMCNTAADELFTEIQLDSIPAVYVYGREGNLAKRFEGPNGQDESVSYEKQVVPLVGELVKTTSSNSP